MSENPFDKLDSTNQELAARGEFYSTKLKRQFECLEVGQAMKADLFGRTPNYFRSMLTYAAASMGVKFKTKTNSNGDIWVKRVW